MTEQLQEVCRAVPEGDWKVVQERASETVSCADV
jgi:hypothetical protein